MEIHNEKRLTHKDPTKLLPNYLQATTNLLQLHSKLLALYLQTTWGLLGAHL